MVRDVNIPVAGYFADPESREFSGTNLNTGIREQRWLNFFVVLTRSCQ